MILIIAHRGYWQYEQEKNSKIAFERALKMGFGIETDLRDFNNEIVISHDIPTKDSMFFYEFINLIKEHSPVTLALNIKSDGLQEKVINDLEGYENYFVFDMSIPDALGYQRKSITNYTRFSDVEPFPTLFDGAEGVWLDNFSDNSLNFDALNEYIKAGKKIALVSPELHKFEHSTYWQKLKLYLQSNPEYSNIISICTDFPEEAQGFFNEQ